MPLSSLLLPSSQGAGFVLICLGPVHRVVSSEDITMSLTNAVCNLKWFQKAVFFALCQILNHVDFII
jgi:hypothetical protein